MEGDEEVEACTYGYVWGADEWVDQRKAHSTVSCDIRAYAPPGYFKIRSLHDLMGWFGFEHESGEAKSISPSKRNEDINNNGGCRCV